MTALTHPRTKHDEYQNHEKRIEVMDEQRLAAVLLFPTLGVGVEQDLRHDPGATMACLSSFNKWLEEDWGFAHQNRIFAAPMISPMPSTAAARPHSSSSRSTRIGSR